MTRRALCGMMLVLAGCGNLSGVLGRLGGTPSTITLRLVNETAFAVAPGVFVGDVAGNLLIPALTEEVLTLEINAQSFGDLSPGEEVTRAYDCDTFKAVMAKDAELNTGIGISPDADSDVFVVDEQFNCGDTVTIRYSGGLTRFEASISVSAFDPLGFLSIFAGQ